MKSKAQILIEEIISEEAVSDTVIMIDGIEDLLFRLDVLTNDLNKELATGEAKAMLSGLINDIKDSSNKIDAIRSMLLSEPLGTEVVEPEEITPSEEEI